MQLRTSFFNPTVYKKNLTRFAPVWLCYGLCLVLGLVLMYSNGGNMKHYWFASHMADMIPVMGLVNLGYALLTAQLLFGDLFNSRMCNALHAMPLRREGWFFTHVAAGLTFSLVPTALMAVLSLPLLAGSLFEGAWKLAVYFFVAANLQYICYFGIAVFAVMVTGNRFAMVAGYGLINFGAQIVYFLVDTIYTPMLYGVITPYTLAENLTPVLHMTNHNFVEMDNISDLQKLFGNKLEGASSTFTLTEDWKLLFFCAGAGIAFVLAALLLYKKRDLECAGDAVAFKILEPVFQIPCAIVVAAAAQFFLENFLGVTGYSFLVLSVGLVVGWFVGKMLLERTTRVFRLKNWYGLAALFAAIGASLLLTHIDILGIEDSQPDAADIKAVAFYTSQTANSGMDFTSDEDIEDILRLQKLALEERLEEPGGYVNVDGQLVRFSTYTEQQQEAGITKGDTECVYATQVYITYELESGKIIKRRYNVWSDGETGDICREKLSRWDVIQYTYWWDPDTGYEKLLDKVMSEFEGIQFPYASETAEKKYQSIEDAYSLLEAIQADCAANRMVQDRYLHYGFFRMQDSSYDKGYVDRSTYYFYIRGKSDSWCIDVFADCENTVRWLQERDLLRAEVYTDNITSWNYG